MSFQRRRHRFSLTQARPGRTPGSNHFNGRLRDELLNGWHFDCLLEAKVLIEDWRIDYNLNRPHTAHGDLTPNEFAQAWIDQTPTSTRISTGPFISDPLIQTTQGTRSD